VTPSVRILLAAILLVLVAVECAWATVSHFDVDVHTMLRIAAFDLIPLTVGLFYVFLRPDPRMSTVMFALAFLLLFAPLGTILNYFAVSIAGHPIDAFLAQIDRAMGVNWLALMLAIAHHPAAITILSLAYSMSALQIAIPIALIGFNGDLKDISRLCVATAICALSSIAFWTALPSFGAYTVYDLTFVAEHAPVSVDTLYPKFLLGILAHGPGHIDPANARGLIGFPSFHTEEIVLAIWYLRKQVIYFLPMLVFTVLALASVPISGGHHIVDVIGGFLFAAGGIALAGAIVGWLEVLEGRWLAAATASIARGLDMATRRHRSG
jgi:hypothetical protein